MTQAERRTQLNETIAANLEKWKQAQRQNDRGRMTLFSEIMSDCRRTLALLPEIYALRKEKGF